MAGVEYLEVGAENDGQRVDNFLFSRLPKVPKTRLYRAMRKGEVRVNRSRVKPTHRLKAGDQVRIPPLNIQEISEKEAEPNKGLIDLLESQILYEDEHLLVINKPAGVAVHAGSGEKHGVIEGFRFARPNQPFLELAHRLDKETSGCLLLAKTRPMLLQLQEALREQNSEKEYIALVRGQWNANQEYVRLRLTRDSQSNKRGKMSVDESGVEAKTRFTTKKQYSIASLMRVELFTGRTHQIRVHAAESGYPLAGDDKYGDYGFNRQMKAFGLDRLFLHAARMELQLAQSGQRLRFEAPLAEELDTVCRQLQSL